MANFCHSFLIIVSLDIKLKLIIIQYSETYIESTTKTYDVGTGKLTGSAIDNKGEREYNINYEMTCWVTPRRTGAERLYGAVVG